MNYISKQKVICNIEIASNQPIMTNIGQENLMPRNMGASEFILHLRVDRKLTLTTRQA